MQIPSNIRKQATEYDQAKRASGIITSGIIPLSLLSVTDENEEESETRTIKERLVSAVLACVALKLSMSFHSLVPFSGSILSDISIRKDKIEYESRLKVILGEAIKHDGVIDNMAHEFMKMPPKTRERLISSILDFEKQAQDSKNNFEKSGQHRQVPPHQWHLSPVYAKCGKTGDTNLFPNKSLICPLYTLLNG